ncbi:hypothetical protein QCA50_004527 [Cerrena zonata]|uniref:Uncharacterized protein n=1 Tax=Cerrena zonata TaxID=2478898 RepID=A0AAW0GSJ3_9APHY
MYYVRNPRDNLILKTAIFILWVIDMAHLILLSQAFYTYTITNYGNQLQLFQIRWGINGLVILTRLSSTRVCSTTGRFHYSPYEVNSIYTYRIWILSGRNYLLMAGIAIMSGVVFGFGLYFSVRSIELGSFLTLQSISVSQLGYQNSRNDP